MTLEAFNAVCAQLRATTHVVQWGGAHVWKVGGKVFAIAAQARLDAPLAITFKVTPLSYEILRYQDGLRPAPYLAARGLYWIQNYTSEGLDDADLALYIKMSHRLVASGLSKKKQAALGLSEDVG